MNGWLFDQNLPVRLIFSPALPVTHASAIGLNPTDSQLWIYAKEHQLVIVTKDADFSARIILHQPPPWIVHLRFGNLRLSAYHAALSRAWPQIEVLLPAHKLINVHADRIEAIG